MKLITEASWVELHYITEATAGGKKNTVIEGIFMQANKQNRNGRIYEDAVLKPAVEKYVREQVVPGRAIGELSHPEGPSINLDKVSHRITELKWNGDDVVGRALVLDTPMGQIVKGLIEGGVKLGVSSRGMGSLVRKEGKTYVGNDFILNTVDIVQDPSAPDAFVNGIMESCDWIYENGIFKQRDLEKYETEVKRAPAARLNEVKLKVWQDFLSSLNS